MPWKCAGFLTLLVAIDLPVMLLYSTAARLCPAAVSATIDIALRIIAGYAIEIGFFGSSPEPTTLIGVASMILGVVVMAAMREQTHSNTSDVESSAMQNPAPVHSCSPKDPAPTSDDTASVASLASFAASEFVDVEPKKGRFLRFRSSKRLSRAAAATNSTRASTVGAVALAVDMVTIA